MKNKKNLLYAICIVERQNGGLSGLWAFFNISPNYTKYSFSIIGYVS